jgi:hypothetical protein
LREELPEWLAGRIKKMIDIFLVEIEIDIFYE